MCAPSTVTYICTLFQFRTLENYARWQLIKEFLPFMGEEFTNAYNKFTLATQGLPILTQLVYTL